MSFGSMPRRPPPSPKPDGSPRRRDERESASRPTLPRRPRKRASRLLGRPPRQRPSAWPPGPAGGERAPCGRDASPGGAGRGHRGSAANRRASSSRREARLTDELRLRTRLGYEPKRAAAASQAVTTRGRDVGAGGPPGARGADRRSLSARGSGSCHGEGCAGGRGPQEGATVRGPRGIGAIVRRGSVSPRRAPGRSGPGSRGTAPFRLARATAEARREEAARADAERGRFRRRSRAADRGGSTRTSGPESAERAQPRWNARSRGPRKGASRARSGGRLGAFRAAEEDARAEAARLATLAAARTKPSTPPRAMQRPRPAAAWKIGSPRFRQAVSDSRPAAVAIVGVALVAGRVLWRIARG